MLYNTLGSLLTDIGNERDKDFIQPFHAPDDTEKAGCYSPDIMLTEEKDAFPYLLKYVNGN